jgi:hypothetical protein
MFDTLSILVNDATHECFASVTGAQQDRFHGVPGTLS